MRFLPQTLFGVLGLAALTSSATAQFNDQWLTLTNQTNARLPGGDFSVSDINNEVDFAWGDVDKDGFTDLVVVRKEPFTSTGRRTNILLMNEGGVLQDRTGLFATASDVAGDQGFLTATNDRDVVLSDFDQDGWLDIITATTLSDGLSKELGHPRVYMNLGDDQNGNWLGYRYEASRIPQMVSFSTGQPENPRFCSVAAGDVTGDGFPDLYFGDYDSSGAGGSGQPAGKDLNDRLLINDGNGFFTDESQLRMTAQMLQSAFGNSVDIQDYNRDGLNDILKDTSLNAPQYVAISYNDPNNPGVFNIFDDFSFNAPYHTSSGDLNRDGSIDVIISDDAKDMFRLNIGVDQFGRVEWSNGKLYDFITGGDDGFGSNNLIADLDGDGWNDTLHCDVDVDIGGYSRRLHIYHNRTTTPGAHKVVLREERENSGNGWIGAVGLSADDLRGTHDVAVFDVDNDGDNDLVIGRKDGTQVWINPDTPPAPCGVLVYGQGASPANTLALNATGTAAVGSNLAVTTTNVPTTLTVHGVSSAQASAPIFGGVALIDLNSTLLPIALATAAGGQSTWNVAIPANPGLAGLVAYIQSAAADPGQAGGWALSNGIEVTVCP